MMTLRHTFWLMAVLISLVFSGWYLGSSPPRMRLDKESLLHAVDFEITDLKFNEFDTQGHLVKHLETVKLHHVPFQNKFTLQQPHLSFQGKDPTAWQLEADKAITHQGLAQIHFQHHVILRHPPDTVLYTESLSYLPEKQQVLSAQPILLKQALHQLTADHMRIELQTNQVVLKNAHAIIQAPSLKRHAS